MDSAKYVTQHKRINISIGNKLNNEKKKLRRIKCAGQYTVNLINNNISRDVQPGCTGYIHSSYTDDGE